MWPEEKKIPAGWNSCPRLINLSVGLIMLMINMANSIIMTLISSHDIAPCLPLHPTCNAIILYLDRWHPLQTASWIPIQWVQLAPRLPTPFFFKTLTTDVGRSLCCGKCPHTFWGEGEKATEIGENMETGSVAPFDSPRAPGPGSRAREPVEALSLV